MTKTTTTMATIRRRIGARIARLSPEQARAKIEEQHQYSKPYKTGNVAGGRIGSPMIKEITGGFSSQSIDMIVLRKLGERAGMIGDRAQAIKDERLGNQKRALARLITQGLGEIPEAHSLRRAIARHKPAKIVEVVRRHGQYTLGGDIDALSAMVKERFRFTSDSRAQALISSACERLELACDSRSEMAKITEQDILDTIASIRRPS